MLIDNFTQIKQGSTPFMKAYQGETLLWPKPYYYPEIVTNVEEINENDRYIIACSDFGGREYVTTDRNPDYPMVYDTKDLILDSQGRISDISDFMVVKVKPLGDNRFYLYNHWDGDNLHMDKVDFKGITNPANEIVWYIYSDMHLLCEWNEKCYEYCKIQYEYPQETIYSTRFILCDDTSHSKVGMRLYRLVSTN